MNTDFNPYLPPRSEIIPLDVDRPIVHASTGRRFGTFVVDYICYLAVAFCVGVIIGLFFGADSQVLQEGSSFVLGAAIYFGYYVFFEALWARTPGKLLFGTVVVNDVGGKPSFGQVVGRSVCRWIPFEPLSCFGERGWHDSISKTHVVRIQPGRGG